MVTIAMDAMGGDFAPRAPVAAALRAAEELSCKVLLVGDAQVLQPDLARQAHDPERIRIHHTPDHILMDEAPAEALRKKPQASLRPSAPSCPIFLERPPEPVVLYTLHPPNPREMT